jgi:uncharacterized membrane protein
MATENLSLMQSARESLAGKWGMAVGATLVYIIILVGVQEVPKLGPIAGLIIGGPFALGFSMFSLNIARGKDSRLEQIFDGFKKFGVAIGAYVISIVFVLLWMLLLIVPGIIAALSYSMIFYIIADDDSISGYDALKKSKQMMDGHKMKLFRLCLRFFGWGLLCILTLGIGFLWLMPYMQVTFAKFYEDIKSQEQFV